ncbi:MAG TPA: hypothetical protein DCZ91_26525 [Lachnospiraceae bacterium]|nr:hypothetical protein [Lachnospiraceae bacterium]
MGLSFLVMFWFWSFVSVLFWFGSFVSVLFSGFVFAFCFCLSFLFLFLKFKMDYCNSLSSSIDYHNSPALSTGLLKYFLFPENLTYPASHPPPALYKPYPPHSD